MNKSNKSKLKTKIVNFFGGFGYLIAISQWLFSTLLFFEPINNFVNFITPKTDSAINPILSLSPLPEPILAIIGSAIVAAIIGMCVFVIFKIPFDTAKKTSTAVRNTAKNTAPRLLDSKNKKNTVKIRLKLTAKIIAYIKLALVIVPIFIAYSSRFLYVQALEPDLALIISLIWASMSLILFGIEYLLAHMLKIPSVDIW